MIIKSYRKELSEKNLIKYKGKAPSVELVVNILKESELSKDRFELIYGLPEKTLERYILGKRGMPDVYWHIFYEFNNLEKFYRNFKVKKVQKKKEVVSPSPTIADNNKSIIDAYRAKFGSR